MVKFDPFIGGNPSIAQKRHLFLEIEMLYVKYGIINY